VLTRPHKRSTTKTRLKNSLSPLRHFTEHLVGVFEKLPRENDLDRESSRLLIRAGQCHARDSTCKHQDHTYSNPERANRKQSLSLPDEEHGTLESIAPTQLNPRTEDQRKSNHAEEPIPGRRLLVPSVLGQTRHKGGGGADPQSCETKNRMDCGALGEDLCANPIAAEN
jgi:hypothetical protein